jgi:hypothetical protein
VSLVRINWKPGPAELRKFGWAMLIGFGLIGLILQFWLHRPLGARGCWIFGAVAGLLGLTGTKVALPVYWAWMGIAFVLGNVMGRVVLALFYFGMITPMGWVMRLGGRDKLTLRRGAHATYWRDCPPPADKARYERQF